VNKLKLVALTAFTIGSLGLALPVYAEGHLDPCRDGCEEPEKPGKPEKPEKEKGNNGVGNGIDPQPPGNPPVNDGPGTGPGNPGNKNR